MTAFRGCGGVVLTVLVVVLGSGGGVRRTGELVGVPGAWKGCWPARRRRWSREDRLKARVRGVLDCQQSRVLPPLGSPGWWERGREYRFLPDLAGLWGFGPIGRAKRVLDRLWAASTWDDQADFCPIRAESGAGWCCPWARESRLREFMFPPLVMGLHTWVDSVVDECG